MSNKTNPVESESRGVKSSSEKSLDKYNDALDYYYKLKQEYEDIYKKKKNHYLKNPKLTREEVKKKIKSIKRNCLVCKKSGGMIFSNNEGRYRCRCNANEPCSFNIELKRGHYVLMPEILNLLNKEKNEKMIKIIALKLSLLFGLKDKEIVLKEFQDQREDYKKSAESFNTIKALLNELDETTITEKGEEKTIPTSSYITQLNNRLKEAMRDFKKMLHEYNNPISDDKNVIILQRALELYLETIMPIQEKIRRAKYNLNTVDISKDVTKTYSLIQKRHTLSQYEFNLPGHESEIINMK